MAVCTAITRGGERCRGVAIDASGYCYAHHPEHAGARRRAARKGGIRGGRGRPSAELGRLQGLFEGLAEKVLAGDVERGTAAVVGQLYNGARGCVVGKMKAMEVEELVERLEVLEDVIEQQREARARRGA